MSAYAWVLMQKRVRFQERMYVFIMGSEWSEFCVDAHESMRAFVRVLRASIMDLDNATASLY